MIRCFIFGYIPNGANAAISTYVRDTSTSTGFGYNVNMPIGNTDTSASIQLAAQGIVQAKAVVDGFSIDEFIWPELPMAHTFANPSRSLDTAFQISATRDVGVNYSITIASSLSLTTGQLGSVELRYADDSAFTTNVVTLSTASNGNTGTLTIGLNTVQTAGAVVSGIIPSGKYVKLVSVDTTGTPTQTIVRAQEVLL